MRVRTSPAGLAPSFRRIRAGALACVVFALFAHPAYAQTPSTVNRPRFQGGATFIQAFAVGDFSQRVNTAAPTAGRRTFRHSGASDNMM